VNYNPSIDGQKTTLLGLTRRELEQFAARAGQPVYRGRQLFEWLYRKCETDFSLMSDLPAEFRQRLHEMASASPLSIIRRAEALDGTIKLLLETLDGHKIEAVAIPEGERLTACLSSQAGCALDCRFCATARLGFKSNLTTGEIIAQLFALEAVNRRRMTNVVMMGMGEPLLNCEAVFKAVVLITEPTGIGLSHSHFTLSTVGWRPGIEALIKAVKSKSMPGVKLALSLNAAHDDQRKALMPAASRYTIDELLSAAKEYAQISDMPVSITYLLLAGENDALSDARMLAKLAHKYNLKVNLIEYNYIGDIYRRASSTRSEAFFLHLKNAGLIATLRTSRGTDIAAACGQLAGTNDNNNNDDDDDDNNRFE